jgi:hypothetical protein
VEAIFGHGVPDGELNEWCSLLGGLCLLEVVGKVLIGAIQLSGRGQGTHIIGAQQNCPKRRPRRTGG